VNYRKSSWVAFWSVACIVGLGGLAGCGGEDEPTGAIAPAADASVDATTDGPLSEAGKAAKCIPTDAADLEMKCLCNTCPSVTYDCFFASDSVATGCQAVVACALQTGCTTPIDCAKSCGAVLTDAGNAAILAAQAVQQCSVSCVPPAPDAGGDAKADAPAESSTDAQTDTAVPDSSSSDAPVDTALPDADDAG
jgi:hypothetical protein